MNESFAWGSVTNEPEFSEFDRNQFGGSLRKTESVQSNRSGTEGSSTGRETSSGRDLRLRLSSDELDFNKPSREFRKNKRVLSEEPTNPDQKNSSYDLSLGGIRNKAFEILMGKNRATMPEVPEERDEELNESVGGITPSNFKGVKIIRFLTFNL